MNILFLLLIAIAYVFFCFQKVIQIKKNISEIWSKLYSQLIHRCDIVSDLINTLSVENILFDEESDRKILDTVTHTINGYSQCRIPEDVMRINRNLAPALKNLFKLADKSLDLRIKIAFDKTRYDILRVENRIEYTRQIYNAEVSKYNKTLLVFPNMYLAKFFNLNRIRMFTDDECQRSVPKEN